MKSKTVVATRVHKVSSSSLADTSKIISFLDQLSCELIAGIIICVDIKEDLSDIVYFNQVKETAVAHLSNFSDVKVIVVPVSVWGKFTFPLNIAIHKALEHKYEYIIFQSIEFHISSRYVQKLQLEIEVLDTLVVGPMMSGHEFQHPVDGSEISPVMVPLRGRTCPWNTMAIWNVRLLGLTGFVMVGDGMGEEWGGVEEVSTIAVLQSIRPNLRAVLVNFNAKYVVSTTETAVSNTIEKKKESQVTWKTEFDGDEVRQKYHEQKMMSKDTRPAKQLEQLQLTNAGTVHHIEVNM